jgi:hypothetical protein
MIRTLRCLCSALKMILDRSGHKQFSLARDKAEEMAFVFAAQFEWLRVRPPTAIPFAASAAFQNAFCPSGDMGIYAAGIASNIVPSSQHKDIGHYAKCSARSVKTSSRDSGHSGLPRTHTRVLPRAITVLSRVFTDPFQKDARSALFCVTLQRYNT